MANQLRSCDVAVIGGGPAGASAAGVLAASGLKVLILEKAQPPRYKTCGGGILGRALKLLNTTEIPPVERICHNVEFNLSPTLRLAVSGVDPVVLMTMRSDFDSWLTRFATEAGATLVSNCRVLDVKQETASVRLIANDGEISAKFVVAADGASSITAKKCGWADHRKMVPALECEVSVLPADLARLSRSARFDFHIVPGGYAWVFPKASHLSVGVLTLTPGVVNLNDCFDEYLKQLGVVPVSVERHGFVIPLAPRSRVLARNRVLLTGDAAGLADPVTAEGISYAIQSGQLAGRAIVRGFANQRQVPADYNAALRREILPQLFWGRCLAKVLYGMPGLRDAVFRRHGQQLTKAMVEVVGGRADYRGLMIEPMNYAKLLMGS